VRDWIGRLAVAAVAIACVVPASAGAGGRAVTVAHGVSPEGVPWHIEAKRWHSSAYLHFDFDPPAYSDVGWGASFPLPAPHLFLYADTAADISPYAEGDLGGVTARRVRQLEARMSDGSSLTFTPSRAPERIRARRPWLRPLRFFDVFYPSSARPKVLRAFDADGNRLATYRSHPGLFSER
jgi:hypothetical protein